VPINLDVVIDTPGHSVDMKAGLDSLQGVSDATRIIAETVLEGVVPKRLTSKGRVRTNLKQSFKGSYGHVFSLDFYDDDLKRKFDLIGRSVFVEIMAYFISESLYKDSSDISNKAQQIISQLGGASDALVKQLRVSALEKIHEISEKFNHGISIRFRKNRIEHIVISSFDSSTALALQAREYDEKIDLMVSVTRLNINTGNGRFLVRGASETVAFGFGMEYRDVNIKAKKIFSENLDHNNGLNEKDWKFLKVSVTPIKLQDERIVKYIVRAFYND
jgi:hypothetical protein